MWFSPKHHKKSESAVEEQFSYQSLGSMAFCCQQTLQASAEAWELQVFFPHPLCIGQPHWWYQHCYAMVTPQQQCCLNQFVPTLLHSQQHFPFLTGHPCYCQQKCLCSYVQNQVRDLIPAKKKWLNIRKFFPAGISSSVWSLGWLHKQFSWHIGGKMTGVEMSTFTMNASPKGTWLFCSAFPLLSASVGWSCKGNRILVLHCAPRAPHPPYKEHCAFPIYLLYISPKRLTESKTDQFWRPLVLWDKHRV